MNENNLYETENNQGDQFVQALRQVAREAAEKALAASEEKRKEASVTKESIMAIKDRTARQAAIRANMHLFTGGRNK